MAQIGEADLIPLWGRRHGEQSLKQIVQRAFAKDEHTVREATSWCAEANFDKVGCGRRSRRQWLHLNMQKQISMSRHAFSRGLANVHGCKLWSCVWMNGFSFGAVCPCEPVAKQQAEGVERNCPTIEQVTAAFLHETEPAVGATDGPDGFSERDFHCLQPLLSRFGLPEDSQQDFLCYAERESNAGIQPAASGAEGQSEHGFHPLQSPCLQPILQGALQATLDHEFQYYTEQDNDAGTQPAAHGAEGPSEHDFHLLPQPCLQPSLLQGALQATHDEEFQYYAGQMAQATVFADADISVAELLMVGLDCFVSREHPLGKKIQKKRAEHQEPHTE